MQFDIRRFDIYRKLPKDLTQPTRTGAVISIVSIIFIIYLFMAELFAYLTPELASEIYVDDPVKAMERIPVILNISLPNLKCEYVGLDIQDDMGRHEVGIKQHSSKDPINAGQGCTFVSSFAINKVPGNFHVSTHSSEDQPETADFSHIINYLRIGQKPPKVLATVKQSSFAALKNTKHIEDSSLTHEYLLRIVPTVFSAGGGNRAFPYQYTVLHRSYNAAHMGHMTTPAIWFRYDLAPVTVKYSQKYTPFYHFLTNVCAIVGGSFTVAGIVDSCIFTASEIFRKAELGKLT